VGGNCAANTDSVFRWVVMLPKSYDMLSNMMRDNVVVAVVMSRLG